MNRSKRVLGLLSVSLSLLVTVPAGAATPEPFTLGAPAPVSTTLPQAVAPTKGKPVSKPAVKAAATSKAKPAAKATTAKKPVASKSKARKSADVIASDIPPVKLDLTLPKDMVNQLQPKGKPAASDAAANAATAAESKPLLPSLFSKENAEAFQLNGRLLTNEMDLQLRNDRREVEGAALDFKFNQ